jgi:uncharacterized integral membrane protein (TIGR00697 family)
MIENAAQPNRLYTVLCVLFTTLIVVGNLIYQKIIQLPLPCKLHTFELSVGTILYPLTFMITDLIAEFFDKKHARFCVRLAMIVNIMVAGIIAGMNLLPATSWSKVDNQTFNLVFGAYGIAFIGSIIATYVSQTIDIRIYLWLKKLTQHKYLWVRSNISTAISLLIDTSIVISILTMFNVLPKAQLVNLIFNSYSFKFCFVICSTPLFYLCVNLIKMINNVPKN